MTETTRQRDCSACNTTPRPATVCLDCAQAGHVLGCTPEHHARYCRHCAAVYDHVAACFSFVDEDREDADPDGPAGLSSADYFHVWACTSSDGAPADQLRLIAGYCAGWRTRSGAAWPLPAHLLTH